MSLFRFVVVISNHDEGLGRISSRSVYLILGWQKEEVGGYKKEVYELCLQECWQLFVGHLFIGLLLSFFSYAVIHTKHRTGLDLRFGVIQSVGTI
jgi:hypothetical protein